MSIGITDWDACACTLATSTLSNSKQSGTPSFSRCTVTTMKAQWLGEDQASVVKLNSLSHSCALTVSHCALWFFHAHIQHLVMCLHVHANMSFMSQLMVDSEGM